MRWIFLLMMLLAAPGAVAEALPDIQDRSICAPDGVSLGGYDVVSYWQDSGPILGQAQWSAEHDGAIYRFSSEANLQQFAEAPDDFLPRYRGWCAATLASGTLACPDYTNYKIEDGELLLFEIIGFTNGQDVWNSNPLLHKRNADSHFLRLMNE